MRRKMYGQSQELPCPFCGRRVTARNDSGLPVCRHHRDEEIQLRCACGCPLDVREGKYGAFFLCEHCGPVNYRKALSMNGLPLPSVDEL